jgi:hypothetical protein
MQQEMRATCGKLDVREKVTPHDLRRTFCSKVTALGFGRDAMNRVTSIHCLRPKRTAWGWGWRFAGRSLTPMGVGCG